VFEKILKPTASKRFLFFLVADWVFSLFSLYMAYLLRFNFHIPPMYLTHFWLIYLILTALKSAALALEGQYSIVWRYFALEDMKRVFIAHIISYALMAILLFIFRSSFMPFARSIFIIDFFLSFLLLGGMRLSKRLLIESITPEGIKPTLIIGIGESGASALKAITLQYPSYEPKVIVSWSDESLVGSRINGIKVYPKSQIDELIEKYSIKSIIIVDKIPAKILSDMIERFYKKGVEEVKRLKLLGEGKERLEDLDIEDLLAREPKDLDTKAISNFVKDKRVLITGAGGSIGSEICRQLLKFGARELILVESGEYNLYSISEELKGNIVPKLLSVCDREKLEEVFSEYRPDIVIHAAAYKHVPLCEKNPKSAIENNIVGVMNVIDLSIKYGVKKVVNISTDKAVRPTNIMGATKRVGELYAQNVESQDTEVVSVRFGNVLGSSGSVVPKFKKQIENGGPVTVTDPNITRYFMLIPEACQLVLQAGAIAKGRELFILDMGEPVKIIDLAKKMIRLYGKEDEVDIVITGLREGEKLYEELLIDDAECKTKYDSIYVAGATEYDINQLREDIKSLLESKSPKEAIKKIVPEYKEFNETK